MSHLGAISCSRLAWHLASPMSRQGCGCEWCIEMLAPPAEESALGHEARRVGRRILEQEGGARRHALAEEEEQRVQGLGAAREAVVGAHEPEHDAREGECVGARESVRASAGEGGSRRGAMCRGAGPHARRDEGRARGEGARQEGVARLAEAAVTEVGVEPAAAPLR